MSNAFSKIDPQPMFQEQDTVGRTQPGINPHKKQSLFLMTDLLSFTVLQIGLSRSCCCMLQSFGPIARIPTSLPLDNTSKLSQSFLLGNIYGLINLVCFVIFNLSYLVSQLVFSICQGISPSRQKASAFKRIKTYSVTLLKVIHFRCTIKGIPQHRLQHFFCRLCADCY